MLGEPVDLQKCIKEHTNHIFIIGMLSPRRPGAFLYCRMLELRHYRPDTPKNDDFELIIYTLDESITFYVIIVPETDLEITQSILEECKLRQVLGEPTLIENVKPNRIGFPDGKTYTLENISSHEIYTTQNYSFEEEDKLIDQEEIKFNS